MLKNKSSFFSYTCIGEIDEKNIFKVIYNNIIF